MGEGTTTAPEAGAGTHIPIGGPGSPPVRPAAAPAIGAGIARWMAIEAAARGLLADARSRRPGEELACPHLAELARLLGA